MKKPFKQVESHLEGESYSKKRYMDEKIYIVRERIDKTEQERLTDE
jgi:hypothetical protein